MISLPKDFSTILLKFVTTKEFVSSISASLIGAFVAIWLSASEIRRQRMNSKKRWSVELELDNLRQIAKLIEKCKSSVNSIKKSVDEYEYLHDYVVDSNYKKEKNKSGQTRYEDNKNYEENSVMKYESEVLDYYSDLIVYCEILKDSNFKEILKVEVEKIRSFIDLYIGVGTETTNSQLSKNSFNDRCNNLKTKGTGLILSLQIFITKAIKDEMKNIIGKNI